MVIGHDHDQDRENGFRVTQKGVVLVTRTMLSAYLEKKSNSESSSIEEHVEIV